MSAVDLMERPMGPADFKEIRKALGLSQGELADKLGYGAQSRISEIENGKASITRRTEAAMRTLLELHAAKQARAE